MKKIILFGFVMLFTFFLMACNNNDQSTDEDQANTVNKLRTDQEKIYVGFAIDTLKEERWYRDKENFENKVRELGGNIKTLAANGNQEVQIQQAKLLINEGVDVLVVVPTDSNASAVIVEMAHAAGVKVISYDKLILGANVDYYVSFDNVKVGELQAEMVISEVNKGIFAYVGGSETDNNAKLVREGSMNVLQPLIDSGDVTLVYDQFTANWSGDLAEEQINTYLSENNTNFNAIITAYDGLAGGAIRAIGDQAGSIPVSGQDAELDALKRIVAGTQTGTVYKSIPLLAENAASLAMDIGNGESITMETTINNENSDIPAMLLEPIIVTEDNIEETIVESGHFTKEEIFD